MKMKRVLAAILAATMVFGLTGCMQKSGNKSKKAREAVAVPEDIWAPYEEEVHITTALKDNVSRQFQNGDDEADNPWYREYKRQFNINVTNEWVSADNATKLNLAIAEGNLPDVFVATTQQLKELQEADLIWDLSEVYEKNASDSLKTYYEKYADIFETGKIDGKLYALPQLSLGDLDSTNALWIRKDWREEAGFGEGEVKTVEDLENLMKAVYPKHGKYAITETNQLYSMKAMAPAWGAYPGIWVEQEDGTLGYGDVQPEMKEVLAKYAEWYKEGLIDPEFTTTDGDKMFQKALNDEVGISPFSSWFCWGVGQGTVEKGMDKMFEAYPIPTATGEPAKMSTKFQNYGYIVVSKACPNPDAVLRMVNYYVDFMDEAGGKAAPEIVDYMYDLRDIPAALRVFNPETENIRSKRVIDNIANGSATDTSTWGPDAATYNACVAVTEKNDASHGAEYMIYGGDKSVYGVGLQLIDNGLVQKDAMWGAPVATLAKTGDTLDTILLEGFTKIIAGEEPIDYFDTLVENWNKAGGEKATKEVNETYGK